MSEIPFRAKTPFLSTTFNKDYKTLAHRAITHNS